MISIDLAPCLLGSGTPYFAKLASTPLKPDDPAVRRGSRVTHLRYQVVH